MHQKINVAVVDDQQLFRQGLISLLEEFKEINIAFEASNGKEMFDKIRERQLPPDVILLDIEMPLMDGIEATEKLKMKYPRTRIIILTMHDEEEMIVHLIEKGAHGFLPKNEDFDRVIDAIYSVTESGFYFNEKVSKAMVSGLVKTKKIIPNFVNCELSDKEIEVTNLICKEFTNKEIGEKMNLSVKTIDNYRMSILKKIGAKNTAGIVMYAVKTGLV